MVLVEVDPRLRWHSESYIGDSSIEDPGLSLHGVEPPPPLTTSADKTNEMLANWSMW